MARTPFRPAMLQVLLLAGLACGCAEKPGDELEYRECLFVYSAARHAELFEGREVPVCGSIKIGPDGQPRLSDHVRRGGFVLLDLPTAHRNAPGMGEVLAAVERLRKGEKLYLEARFHGRIEVRPVAGNVLHVTRIDWVGGRPKAR